jgi:biotin carboxylase
LGVVLVDSNPECYCAKSKMFNDSYFVQASIRDPDECLAQLKEFIRESGIHVAGVYTQGCDAEYPVAYLAERLGTPSIGSLKAYLCNNKIETRTMFSRFGIPQPDFSVDDLGGLDFPVVVKPPDNCASRGISIVRNFNEVEAAEKLAKKNGTDHRVLFDQFIDGNEYSVDTVFYNGHMFPCGISDRIFERHDKYRIQNGSITPSLLAPHKQDEIYEVMKKAAAAIGIEWGAFKGDILIDRDEKIYVLEVTARLSGGFDAQFRKPYSYGMNLIRPTIQMAVGDEINEDDLRHKFVRYSQTFSIFPQPGVLKEIIGAEEVKKIPGVKQVFITAKVGQKVDYMHCADRLCHIVICSDTWFGLKEIKQKAEDTLRFITV